MDQAAGGRAPLTGGAGWKPREDGEQGPGDGAPGLVTEQAGGARGHPERVAVLSGSSQSTQGSEGRGKESVKKNPLDVNSNFKSDSTLDSGSIHNCQETGQPRTLLNY